ncbi:FAD-binding protein [Kiloniella sp.]|uniref:FAD-binding protein n=1 Tax=Kiloniella sp. TaxID=1938587 RepID=UPI003B025E5D
MLISGWGRYPFVDAELSQPLSSGEIKSNLSDGTSFCGVARGMGRSYGDSSLASNIITTSHLSRFHEFDPESGCLTCDAGVNISDILDVFVPKGWFPKVTPGTKYVSVGGAIASDVHGKNHHLTGTFCDHLHSFRILVANGEVLHCSKSENRDLFIATCGGMGLTGIILDATFYLQKIKSSFVDETTYKARNLKECFELFEDNVSADYSVAWVDCLQQGDNLGRSLFMLGRHNEQAGLKEISKSGPSIPFVFPNIVLNKYSVNLFNQLYYARVRSKIQERTVHYNPFFYPLDGIKNWNRLYGSNGFVQYQFVIPRDAGLAGMTLILEKIAASGAGSFLSVLKAFGKGNANLLSFPLQGYTLALDFKLTDKVLSLLNELDAIVSDYGGRVYLTKDARMSEQVFKKGYPKWEEFQMIREKYGAQGVFSSVQSKRLGLG